VDIGAFHTKKPESIDIESLGEELALIGIDIEERERSGSYYQIEGEVLRALSMHPGLEILDLETALDKYGDLLREHYWKAVPVDMDKFTALAELRGSGGYFVRVKRGHKVQLPIQACLLMSMGGSLQAPHNIIIAEEDSEVSIVTGCMTMKEQVGLHAGVTEIYVGRGARVNFVMIHRWSRAMHIRPRTGVIVDEDGVFVSHYIAFTELRTLQMMPRVILGPNSRAFLSSIIVLDGGAEADVGYYLELLGNGSSGQIISRSIVKDTSRVVARARIVGRGRGTKGHIDCRGLLLSNGSRILTIPILDAPSRDIRLTHEAAVGRLEEDKILWLIARGFGREEAESLLIRGFMNVGLPELPGVLTAMIDRTLRIITKSML